MKLHPHLVAWQKRILFHGHIEADFGRRFFESCKIDQERQWKGSFKFWFLLQFCQEPSGLLWAMKFTSLSLRSHQENKKVGIDDLRGTILISHSVILRIFSFTWFHVGHIYSFILLNENRKMSYHLPNYFPRIPFTSDFTFPFLLRMRTLPETNVPIFEWRYLSATGDFAQA